MAGIKLAPTGAGMPAGIPATSVGGGAVSNTEFSYLDGVTSALQTQLNGKLATNGNGSQLTALNAGALASGTVPPARIGVGQFVSGVAAGRNGAGAVTLAGAKVGDKVLQALEVTDGADGADARSSFEATITVEGQIQQSDAGNLSAKKYSFLLLSQS